MRLVPVEVALLALPAPALRRLAPALVRLGGRVEVDVDAVRDEGLRYRLLAYLEQLGRGPAAAGLLLDVTLVDRRQSTSRGSAADLTEELAALDALHVARPLVALLETSPPEAIPGVRVERREDGLLRGSLRAKSALWPVALGGPPAPRELSRLVRVTASHAAWRDRRVRRLVRVEVVSRQSWPDPDMSRDD